MRPSRIIFFDVETTQRKLSRGDIAQDFRYGEALYWRVGEKGRKEKIETFSIWKPSDFWDWVESKKHGKCTIYLVSHNLNIDLVVLGAFQELPSRDLPLRSIYIKGLTKIILFGRKGFTLKCLDNANWWRASLAELGGLVGYPKLSVNPVGASLEELIPYCKRDVEILYRLWRRWLDFLDEHQLGNWGPTIGSQAFKAFQHRFMKHSIYIHNNPSAIYLERKAYHGGRVEPFWLGEWEGLLRHKVDVNSMYPFVMREYPYPTVLRSILTEPDLGLVREKLSRYLVIAECEVEVPEPVYPFEGKQGVIYPVGKFKAFLCTPELTYGLERGYIKKVYQMALYQGERIFTEYVDYFYPLKARYGTEGNSVYRTAVKMMLNSLYGKFGQRGSKMKVLGTCRPELVRVETWSEYGTNRCGITLWLGGSVIEIEEMELSYNSFVAISAHCTAYARMYLWEMINEAGRGNYFYVDTDSLLLSDTGLANLSHRLDNSKLGMLKMEGSYSEGAIYGKKDYRLGKEVVLKGIPRKAQEVGDLTFAFDMWPSIKLLIRDGNVSQYYIRPMTRKLRRQLTWGVQGRDGYIHPYRIEPMPELTEEEWWELASLDETIASLKISKRFPQNLLFTVWDYKEGDFRKGVDDLYTAPHYRHIPLDKVAQEYGFTDYNAFLAEVEKQVDIDRRIRRATARRAHLLGVSRQGFRLLSSLPESTPLLF